MKPVCLAALALCFAGCTDRPAATAQACPAGMGRPMRVFELFFGRSMHGGGMVSDQDWRHFVNAVVAPNLPDGFTVFDASGGWMSTTGHSAMHEPTTVLLAAVPEERDPAAIQRIRAAYQQRFRQELVGMTVHPACADF